VHWQIKKIDNDELGEVAGLFEEAADRIVLSTDIIIDLFLRR